jgi:DNA-binding PadR family transcriptional regulator
VSSKSTDLAILGALSVEPMSGYALRSAIRDVLGHFWSESFGQIYPALETLEASGFVERLVGSRSTSSTFAITSTGEEMLRELVREPIPQRPHRHGSLLRLYFGRHLGKEESFAIIEAERSAAAVQLEMYAHIRAEIEADEVHLADSPYWLTTLSFGEYMAKAAVEWADSATALLAEQGAPAKQTKRTRATR